MLETLLKYSQEVPKTGYSEAVKKEIAEALFPNFDEENRTKWIRRVSWSPDDIRFFCSMKATWDVLANPDSVIAQETAAIVDTSLEKQTSEQSKAIEAGLIRKFTSLSYHTLVDKLSQRTWNAAYKFQLSRTPIFEEQDELQHGVIQPSETNQNDPYELLVRNSIFDSRKMPYQLLHLALYHTPGEEHPTTGDKHLLWREAAERMEEVKSFLIGAQALGLTYQWGDTKESTQRILRFADGEKSLGYLLSENTPQVYDEKQMKKYQKNFIRYYVFTDKSKLLKYLVQELPSSHKKVPERQASFNELRAYDSLKEVYNDETLLNDFKDLIEELQKKLAESGLTETEQKVRSYVSSFHFTNPAADMTVLSAMRKVLWKGVYEQKKKINYLQTHIEALKADPHF